MLYIEAFGKSSWFTCSGWSYPSNRTPHSRVVRESKRYLKHVSRILKPKATVEIITSQPLVNKNTHDDVILISRNSWYKPPKNVYFMIKLVHLVNNHLRKTTTGSIWDNLRAQKKHNFLENKKKKKSNAQFPNDVGAVIIKEAKC